MKIGKYKNAVDNLLALFCIIVMVMLVICVVWQVFSRYVLQQPSTSTDEIARFSMIWVGLLGAAYATGKRRHLNIDLFTSELTGIRKLFNQLFIDGAIFFFAATVMVWGGMSLLLGVYETGQLSPALQMPMAYVYLVLPLSGVLICWYSLLYMVDTVKSHLGEPVLTQTEGGKS
ncbi:TRAP transporter small permease [Erwinia sp. P6884]|uniref:TRAP transporter small permease n=1 Tax=Erwinia sp. P6884 TaxID=3141450 RepID=UPI00319216AE